ncbi:MAG: MFS transporter [Janthinobacterium lividum]
MLASSVSGGLLVEAGQQQGWTGRMGALRETIIAGTILAAQPVGGYLVGHAFGWTCGTGAALFFSLVPATLFLLPEAHRGHREAVTRKEILDRLRPVLQSRALWLAAAFIFLKDLSPGFGTPLFFYQTSILHFSPKFIGWLGAMTNGAAIAGALLYAWLCTRLPLKRLLTVGIVLSVVSSLLFLGYKTPMSALMIQGANGLLGVLISVALMDMAARASPRGAEAMSYSLLMSAANLGGTGSDVLGSWLFEKMHVPLPALIWVSAAATALTLLALPLIPQAVLRRHDLSDSAQPL